jgi:phosphatidylserine/phosphatidylglycerophosphate/cardiolipin synthase-like enzyme
MHDAFALLTDDDLQALAEALRAGRLSPPFAALTLQAYCSSDGAARVAGPMQQLASEGMCPAHLAVLLEAVAQARARRPTGDALVELVWTGPEAPDSAPRDTGVVVRELFRAARKHVLVAGYAVYQGKEVFRALAERMAAVPGLRVRIFLDVQRRMDDPTPSAELVSRFARRFRKKEWPGERLPQVFYDPRSLDAEKAKRSSLHAKCVVVDRQVAFVSSANFTEAAQVRNIEVGALVRSAPFAAGLVEHFEALAGRGELLPLPVRE